MNGQTQCGILFSLKTQEILTQATVCVNPEVIMLSEIRQILNDSTYRRHLQKSNSEKVERSQGLGGKEDGKLVFKEYNST